MYRIVEAYFSVVQLKAISDLGNSQSCWVSNRRAISRKFIMVKGMGARSRILNLASMLKQKLRFTASAHPSPRPRSEARPPRTYAPTPGPNSIQIQQPTQVTPVRRPRGESREAFTSKHCRRIRAKGCYPDCYPK